MTLTEEQKKHGEKIQREMMGELDSSTEDPNNSDGE